MQQMLADEQKQTLKQHPRRKDPIAIAFRVSTLGALGLFAGYTFAERVQPSFEFAYSDTHNVYAPSKNGTPEIDGWFQGWWFRGGLQLFLLDGWFTPVVGAGMQVGTGEFSSFGGFGGLDFFGGSDMQARFHAAEATVGFDMQLQFGAWTRLSAAYRPLIWNQARTGPGSYDPIARDGLANWYRRSKAFDVIWLLGWAF